MSVVVIAEWLNVTAGQVRRWLTADIEVMLTGGKQ